MIHGDRAVGQDAARLVYVGDGRNDPQCRPSVFYNPFFYLHESEAVANDRFGQWLCVRADLQVFLQPLLGMALLCDCRRGLGCHVHTLLRVLDRVYPPPGDAPPHFGYVDNAKNLPVALLRLLHVPGVDVRRADLSESDDSGTESQVVTALSKPADVASIDETAVGRSIP